MNEVIYRPKSATHLIWIVTERHVTVVNTLDGTSSTVPMLLFNTEVVRRHMEVKDVQGR